MPEAGETGTAGAGADAVSTAPAGRATASGAAGRTVLIGGGTSASGLAVARALVDAGATVITVGSRQDRLDAAAAEIPGLLVQRCDLGDDRAVLELVMDVHARVGDIDGLVSLVGGWRGGGGIPGQTEEDFRFLETSFTALRLTSRFFWDDLVSSDAGRVAIVSSTSVPHPTAGGANYAAVKAASESWMASLADGFAKQSPDAAAVTYRVRSLAGLEGALAASIAGLWGADAPANGAVVPLG
ncbi:SDR family NAD(P)-dependent oxidoreductase [Agromyces archimandritae]|uniref:SDR family NAD(P)-dependent oxidoreductase n=1 Tax=Agromyces archimandritae TaxID=2781962 RepID=A0A975IPT2_9MICO|nr:SDR family NAD(P)-dependent oxidoreductase [Agromyces archimandritae]QTX05930.1 SDR family NAD(P)-dependent oxidoreductase [Agromyces archimandritae]